MRKQAAVLVAAIGVALLGGAAAEAQSRLSLEQMKTANCAWADNTGGTYRPFYCDAECPCGDDVPQGTACVETAPGDYEFSWSVNEQCIQAQELCIVGLTGSYCSGAPEQVLTSGSCSTDDDCTAPATCFLFPPLQNLCVEFIPGAIPCTTQADCPTTGVCDDPSRPSCDGGCSGAQSCQPDALCGRACTTDSDCPTPESPFTLSITNVSGPESTTVALCGGLGSNHKDARLCLTDLGCDLCGDGFVDANESCDDGNTTPGDGCDASCQTEP